MPSASNNNQSNTKLVKQTSVNSMNSGGPSGSSAVAGGGGGVGVSISSSNNTINGSNKKLTETSTKSNNNTAPAAAAAANNGNNVETSSNKSAKDNTNNGVAAAAAAAQNGKNWETNSIAGNSVAASATNKDAGNDALNPLKLTFTTIEHKIRNLEKRKTKLEGYRAIAAAGRELSSDQKAAVSKYDAVLATLEFARDLVKQMQQFAKDAEKEQKKQARKELIAKAQAETVKIREVLIIQNILSCFTDDAVRNDFLNGEHGAAKMEPSEMDVLEKFCLDVQTRRPETSEDAPFATSAQKAAEIFSMTIDARPKTYGETTYENVKRIFHRIQESDYLDKIYLTDVPEPEEPKEEHNIMDAEVANNEQEDSAIGMTQEQQQQQHNSALEQQEEPLEVVDPLEEGMERLNVGDNSAAAATAEVVVNDLHENVMMAQQQQLAQQLNEHLEMAQTQQQPPQQVPMANLANAGQPLMPTPMAPPASAVPAFQTTAPAPGHSGATTPVHVAMYGHPNLAAPTAQQMQQLPPGQAIIGGVPNAAGQGQMVANLPPPPQPTVAGGPAQSQQRQIMGSPANVAVPVAGMVAPLQQAPPPPGIYNPTPVHAVEQSYFKQHPPHTQQQQQQQHHHQQQQQQQQQHQQYLQQMRPLAEVIGGGNFYFLQDSELDSPELNAQGQAGPQATLIFEQQQQQVQQQSQQVAPPQQQPQQQAPQMQQQQPQPTQQMLQNLQQQQQQKTSPNILNEHNAQIMTNGVGPGATAHQGSMGAANMPPQQQHLQQQNINQTAPIQTQTFTNQSFPQMPAAQQQQATNVLASNTPSPLFHQQQQMQPQPQQQQPPQTQKPPQQQQQQLFSPVQGQAMQNPQQHPSSQLMMSGSVDVQQPALMLINRLAGTGGGPNPQNPPLMQQQNQQQLQQHQLQQQQQLQQPPQQQHHQPPQGLLQQQQQVTPSPQNLIAGMHQLPPKAAGYHFENPVMTAEYDRMQQTLLSSNLLKKCLDDIKDACIKVSDLKEDTANVEANQWTTAATAEVNANSPLADPPQHPQTQRKNEWSSSATTGPTAAGNPAASAAAVAVDSYVNDNRSAEPTNHWHSQDTQGGYGRNSANRQTQQQGSAMAGGQGGSNAGGGYQRRNDDRRGGDDRRPGGSSGQGGGGYRGRSNYSSGGPQQNGNGRGGGGNSSGIYFRNNENNNSGSYYQNGGGGGGGGGGNVYANKEGGGPRYDSGGPGQYRGPRTAGNNAGNPRSNGPPPRHMGGGGGRGQPSNNTNSNSYMNSRQSSNRLPLGLENKN